MASMKSKAQGSALHRVPQALQIDNTTSKDWVHFQGPQPMAQTILT